MRHWGGRHEGSSVDHHGGGGTPLERRRAFRSEDIRGVPVGSSDIQTSTFKLADRGLKLQVLSVDGVDGGFEACQLIKEL